MPGTSRHALITELNEDWARLIGRHRHDLGWGGELAGLAGLAEVLAAIRHRPDPVLGALLALSADGDLLAGRTVLQAMLGKVVRLARTYPDVPAGHIVSTLWCRIRTYPLDRRPRSIAANLALDTRKDLLAELRAAARERAVGTPDSPGWERLVTDPGPPSDLQARQVIRDAEAAGVISPATAAALRAVYLEGVTSRVAAARLGTSAGMVRYRCSRGIRELERHHAESIDAA